MLNQRRLATWGSYRCLAGTCDVQHDKDATGEDQWFTTGDVATIDRFGHFQITDRSKDLIKTGGEWVSSIELDGIIMSHPAVRCKTKMLSSIAAAAHGGGVGGGGVKQVRLTNGV